MLNSTKTWQEELIPSWREYHWLIKERELSAEQFEKDMEHRVNLIVSDLRKRDMDALIKMMDEYFRHLIIIPRPDLTGKKLLQLIKDYYEN